MTKLVLALLLSWCTQSVDAQIRVQGRDGQQLTSSAFRFAQDRILFDPALEIENPDTATTENVEAIEFSEISELQFGEDRVESSPANSIPANSIQIRLVDGSTIYAAQIKSENTSLVLTLPDQLEVTVDNRNVDWVRFEPAVTDERQWIELLAERSKNADALIVSRKGELDYFEGVVGEVSETVVEFSTQDRSAEVKREKLTGLVYYHASGRELSDMVCELSTTSGSKLAVRELTSEADNLAVSLVCGEVLALPLLRCKECDFRTGREFYLSDAPPATLDWNPLVANKTLEATLRRMKLPKLNQTYGGKRLSLRFYDPLGVNGSNQIREFNRGIAAVGGSRLVFVLENRYRHLTGLVGFSPTASSDGAVNLRIHGDGEILHESVLENSPATDPIELDLSVDGVQRLTIEVDYHDRRSIGDLLHFCDLKVSK